MPAGIFLLPQDIAAIRGVGYRQAIRVYKDVREVLGKEKRKRITLEEYATYEMVPVETVKKALNIK